MGIKIAIRADGGQKVGMGHLVRCLSLARELVQMQCQVFFICYQDTGQQMLQKHGFQVELLPEGFDRNQELLAIGAIINREQPAAIIVDSYQVDSAYFRDLHKLVKLLIYIDDLNSFKCSADIMVNGNVNAAGLGYETSQSEQVLLLGAEYNLLRRQFCNLPSRQVNHDITDLMITTGGSDPYKLVPRFTEWLLKSTSLRCHLVVGSGFTDVKTIYRFQAVKPGRVEVYQNLDDLSALMLKADLAISSGGSTLYELCACGTPTLAFIIADNQEGIANWLADNNYLDYLGWYHQVTEQQLIRRIREVGNNRVRRQEMASRGQALFDGQGANRVAEVIKTAVLRGMTTR